MTGSTLKSILHLNWLMVALHHCLLRQVQMPIVKICGSFHIEQNTFNASTSPVLSQDSQLTFPIGNHLTT